MSVERTPPRRHPRAGGDGRTRRRRLCALALALAATALSVDVPTPASAAGVYEPSRPRWGRDEAERPTTYRVMHPPQSRSAGPERAAVAIWQELLNEHGLRAEITGVYDRDTQRAVRAFQARRGLPVTGEVGYATARALLERTIKREAAAAGMSAELLCGHLSFESGLDPSAVGSSGDDLGLGQILMGRWNPGVDVDDALDEDFAVRYMAQRDMAAYRAFGDWPTALFDYNSPTGAHEWQQTGVPSELGKGYSRKAMRGCDGPEFPGEPPGEVVRTGRREAVVEVSADLGTWVDELSTSLAADWDTSSPRADG